MRSIYRLVLKKRWFLFLGLVLVTFLMNLFLWNETSQLIRSWSRQDIIRKEVEKGSLSLVYDVELAADGAVLEEFTDQEKKELYQLLSTTFTQKENGAKIYLNVLEYENGGQLQLVTERVLHSLFLSEDHLSYAFEEFLVRDMDSQSQQEFLSAAHQAGFAFKIISYKDIYQAYTSYYLSNFWFGLVACFVFLGISFLFILILLRASLKICQEELRTLRILGWGKKKLSISLFRLLAAPIVIGLLLFLIFIHLLPSGVIWQDYLYLCLLNSGLAAIVYKWCQTYTKGVLDA